MPYLEGHKVANPLLTKAWKDALQDGWPLRGDCVGADPDLWFPERGADTRAAKAICRTCPVRIRCQQYALTVGEKFGIWGGLSERERRRIRKERRLKAEQQLEEAS